MKRRSFISIGLSAIAAFFAKVFGVDGAQGGQFSSEVRIATKPLQDLGFVYRIVPRPRKVGDLWVDDEDRMWICFAPDEWHRCEIPGNWDEQWYPFKEIDGELYSNSGAFHAVPSIPHVYKTNGQKDPISGFHEQTLPY